MRNQYKVLTEKYEQLREVHWHQKPGNKAFDVFILSELIDTLCDDPKIKSEYYKIKYKELVNIPGFDKSHWDMRDTKKDLKHAKANLNYYYDYVFVSKILENYAPPGVSIKKIDHQDRKNYLKKNYPGVYEDIYKKYSENWIIDIINWKESKYPEQLYRDNPGVNIDI